MRRIILAAMPLIFCVAWGCSSYEAPTPEERGNAMEAKNKAQKDKKEKGKGILAEP